ncbi:MAG: glycosyltransferase [Candidatus Buchananbacteria bacterium]|nr:glycosyltransferase [Candidatus Buchananbacteria bacterium]
MRILFVLPVYNEEKIIKENLLQLNTYLADNLVDEYLIVVADNNSTDRTAEQIQKLVEQNKNIYYFFIKQKGKGLAIKAAWQKYIDSFDVFIFMDADLATDLSATNGLIQEIKNGADMAIGSRYLKEAKVKRTVLRRLFSLVYRLFLKIFLGTKIKDFPCGFKAVTPRIVKEIIPQIKNNTWFFDTEMVYLAEKNNYKIKEVPVKWHEPRTKGNKSRVNLLKVSWQYFKEVLRLKFKD